MGKIKNLLGHYQSIPRALIFDKVLSDRARFVYVYMASKPDDWEFLLKPMAEELKYSVETLRKYINELVERGWISKGEQAIGECGKRFGAVEYVIHASLEEGENFRHGKIPPRENTESEETIHNIKETEERKEKKKEKDLNYDRILKEWNECAKKCGLGTMRGMEGQRKDKIRTLMTKCSTSEEELVALIRSIPHADDWVLGKGGRDWKIDFDWLVANTSNWYVKAVEGGMHKKNRMLFNSIMMSAERVNSLDENNGKAYNERGNLVINGVEYQ